jgi:hypothetical protein
MLDLRGDRGRRGDRNLPTMIGPCSHIGVKRMDAQGFVSKNARIAKPDHKKHAPWLMN